MKKVIPVVFLIIILYFTVFVSSLSAGDRNRFFVMGGLGYASAHAEGIMMETGVEMRLFGRIHLRILMDHYFGNNTKKESETLKRMTGANLYIIYKIPVTETIAFRLKAGGHFTGVKSELTTMGLTFTATKANLGFCAGAGFSFQISNTLYLFSEATIKHLFLDNPWTWVKAQLGLMYRFH